MDIIKPIKEAPGVSLYSLESDDYTNSKIRRYIVSTSQTRQIMTMAEIVSPEFENLLQQGIGAAISRSKLTDIINETIQKDSNSVDILFILRGGLNFDPTTGLGEIGIRTIEHYLSSQRKRISDTENKENDKWAITDDGYKKVFEAETMLRIIDLFLGDIVATGTSLKHGLEEYLSEVKKRNYKLNSLTFFSIGCKRTEEVIEEIIKNNKDILSGDFRANIIYLEGRFGLAKKTTALKLKNPDTDLLVYHENAIISPDFARELLLRPEYVLEPCVIYDGGKRRSAYKAHLNEVIEYWQKLKQLAKVDLTFQSAINERYPVIGVSTIKEWREIHLSWKYMSDSIIEDIIKVKDFLVAGCPNTSSALEELCDRRISEIVQKRDSKGAVKVSGDATHHIGMTTNFIEDEKPTTILISGEPDRTNKIYRMLDLPVRHIKTARSLPIGKGYLTRIIEGKEHRIPVVVATSGMGYGSTEIVTMEIIDTFAKTVLSNNKKYLNIIRVGTCGSHQQNVYGGDLVITTDTYFPFGSVSDLIETKHDDMAYHIKLSLLLGIEKILEFASEINKSTNIQKWLNNVKYKISKEETEMGYTCDREIIKHISETAMRLKLDNVHKGGVFSKATLFSESYKTFSVEPEGIRKHRLDYRAKVMHDEGIYCSEMETALISTIVHLARLKGYNVKIGGIMAVVNNPKDTSRSVNPLFADDMTISMAVDRAILLGLETAVEIYNQQYLRH